jgi:hypothetical protein
MDRLMGPALSIASDQVLSADDLERIQAIGEGSKRKTQKKLASSVADSILRTHSRTIRRSPRERCAAKLTIERNDKHQAIEIKIDPPRSP